MQHMSADGGAEHFTFIANGFDSVNYCIFLQQLEITFYWCAPRQSLLTFHSHTYLRSYFPTKFRKSPDVQRASKQK